MRWRKLSGYLVLFSIPLLAQSDRGTITGTVGDPAGAVVANAPIEVRNVQTDAVYQGGQLGHWKLRVPSPDWKL